MMKQKNRNKMTIVSTAKTMLEQGPGVYTSRGVRVPQATNFKHVYYIVNHGNVFRTDPKTKRTKKIL